MKPIISSITLLLMGIYGLMLYFSETLTLYIHPRFVEESFAASLIASIIGVISLIYFGFTNRDKLKRVKNLLNGRLVIIITLIVLSFFVNTIFLFLAMLAVLAPDKSFNKLIKGDFLFNLVTIFTVLIAIVLPPQVLSSVTASQRSIDLNSINLTQSTISAVQNFNKSTANYSLGDWIAMQGFNPDPLYYKDKDVKVSGFLYKAPSLNLDENTYLVARFIITCCAVDARPVGLKVLINNNQEFKIDDWIEVEGKFNVDTNGELIIIPTSVTKIEEPKNPYIF